MAHPELEKLFEWRQEVLQELALVDQRIEQHLGGTAVGAVERQLTLVVDNGNDTPPAAA